MLKIFLSSTYRDLFEIRKKILEEVENILRGIGMEKFVPDGSNSQEVCITALKESDIVVFLISSYYGSLMKECTIMDTCKADCPMKTGEGRISYTHCEYKTIKAEGIQHMAYLIKEGWNEIWDLKGVPDNEINLSELKNIPFFEKMDDKTIDHYIEIRKEACSLNVEIDEEYRKEIENIREPENVQMIKNHLADNILKWYSVGKIEFMKFVDRRDELEDLNQSLEQDDMKRVEVYGVGGIGKTSLIQIALLIQRLRGKKIVTVGTEQTYSMGSGYSYAAEKLKDIHHEVSIDKVSVDKVSIGKIISLDDVLEALSVLLPDVKNLKGDIKKISKLIETEGVLLFIDDAHLAKDDVKELIRSTKSLVLSSRERTGLAKKVIALVGIGEEDREDLINLIKPKGLTMDQKIIINNIAEGHPIFTTLLVNNFQEINFNKLIDDKPRELKKANHEEWEEFLKRVIEEILSEKKDALILLKDLSIINDNLEDNIHDSCVEKAYNIEDVDKTLNKLVQCGLLKKRKGKDEIYEFSFKHIRLALVIDTDSKSHEKAVQYYKTKRDKIGKSVDDSVEILFHLFKSNPSEDLISKYVKLAKRVSPKKYSFKRLIDIGEQIIDSFHPEDVFRDDHKAIIIITLGHLYNKLERYKRAETLYKKAWGLIKDVEGIVVDYINRLLSTDNNLFFDLFDEFIGYYMVYISKKKVIKTSPWKELSSRLSKIIEDPANDEIRNKIQIIFSFFVNMLGYEPKKLYFYEANELAQILVAEKPTVEEITNACALYDQLRWMATTVKEDDKDLSLKTAELYEEYANVFDEAKETKTKKERETMRPYNKILESAAWHYQLGQEYIKSAEKYVEICGLEFDKFSVGMQKFNLWMAALNFSRGEEHLKSTEHYINLAKLLIETQQISELAVDLYKKATPQLGESNVMYDEIKERYQKVKKEFDTQKKSCEESEVNALLVSNIYDKIAADIVGSYLYLNNIDCDFETNIKTKDELLEYNGKYDYIILHGGSLAPVTGPLIVEMFGEEKDFAKLYQTTYSYKNVWTLNIKDTKTKWILLAGNGAETTLEAVDMFKKGSYLKE